MEKGLGFESCLKVRMEALILIYTTVLCIALKG